MYALISRPKKWISEHKTLVMTFGGLLGLLVVAVLANFPESLWLTGWDNLHPEFNFPLNFRRAIFGVWQENQGLGHLGGHGHAAMLLHTLFLWLMSVAIPQAMLRSSFTALMYVIGPLGAWVLTRWMLKDKKWAEVGGLGAGVFYAFNLATVQQFYFQLEAFIIFFGILPWAWWRVLAYLEKPKRRNLVWMGVVTLLLSPIGFIPPLFVIYGLSLGCILGSYVLVERSWDCLRRSLIVLILTLVSNLYWLLPVSYFTLTSSGVYLRAQNNLLSTPGFNLQSKAYGGWDQVIKLEGFVLDAIDFPVDGGESVMAMQVWQEYAQKEVVLILSVMVIVVALTGGCWALLSRKYGGIGIFLWLVLGFVALAQRATPLDTVSEVLKEIPIIDQAFRAAFTKVSIPLSLAYAVMWGHGLVVLGQRLKIKKWKSGLVLTVMAILPVFIGWPILTGNLYYERLKTTPPDEYFQLFEYFKNQDKNDRVAVFPLPWNWGWSIYDWGYTGSGFLWYGIEQPIMDRSFDSWSGYNESYYTELSRAMDRGDVKAIARVLNKYEINQVVIDRHVIKPGASKDDLKIDQVEEMLRSEYTAHLGMQGGGLEVYQINEFNRVREGKETIVGSNVLFGREDFEYEDGLDRIDNGSVVLPFGGLVAPKLITGLSREGNKIVLNSEPIDAGQYSLKLPGLVEGNRVRFEITPVWAEGRLDLYFVPVLPKIVIDGVEYQYGVKQVVSTKLPKTTNLGVDVLIGNTVLHFQENETKPAYTSLRIGDWEPVVIFETSMVDEYEFIDELQTQPVKKCWEKSDEKGSVVRNLIEDGVELWAQDATNCLSARIGDLAGDGIKLMRLAYKYKMSDGSVPDICISKNEDSIRTCYNQKTSRYGLVSNSWYQVDELLPITERGDYWLDIFARSQEDQGKNNMVSYAGVKARIYNAFDVQYISDHFWEPYLQDIYIDVKLSDELIESIYDIPEEYSLIDTLSTKKAENCDVFDRGIVGMSEKLGSLNLTASNGGVACIKSKFEGIPLDQGYLLSIDNTVMEGKGLDVLLRNEQTNSQEILTVLTGDENVSNFSVIPTQWGAEIGAYAAELNTWSYKNVRSVNVLSGVTLSTYPVDWLGRVELKSKKGQVVLNSDLMVKQVTQTGIGNYLVQVENNRQQTATESSGLVVLGQGHDKGWNGYEIDNSQFSIFNNIKTAMPWWFGEKLRHVKVNGWANGWVVDNSTPSSSPLERGREIVIVYWPQYLEWMGLGMLGITLVGLVALTMKERRQRKDDAKERRRSTH